ncbi:hypothetical protein MY494_13075 [Synechococcus sp. A10-1-5-1]|uniref:hypothetical protein n=1 Tax=Synechococcus sp. A10-1-5-1 TaxID=2936507 RepID=UPI0020005EE9|nr:hypothetical protein [Synechococcus sp. A10-1-5-1]UPM50216.1 hypothetical protein MY494_13075 [Synechococcus sp. A10-1-5-1]
MNSDAAIEQSCLLSNDTKLVVGLNGVNHSYPKEERCQRREHGIEVSVDQIPWIRHEFVRDSLKL